MTEQLAAIGRLAPSPTGAQHVGNARTYLLAWWSIRSQAGRMLLRMEDIDSPRVKRGADQQAIDDLRWLGIDWDEGPDLGGPNAPYVQTERGEWYRHAHAQLAGADRIYPCTCSRTDVQAAASAPHAGQEGPVYPGTCANRRAADAQQLADRPYAWRFRATDAARQLEDAVAGVATINVARQLGDFVVARRDGSPAYQLAVVVDDHSMGITEVVRGSDLLPSALRQWELYECLGWKPPRFAHVPLVIGEDGRRLAKRHGDTRLTLLRELGVRPERLVGLLAWSCGLMDRPQPIAARELIAEFSWDRLPRDVWTFTAQHWSWLTQ
jgi:glutamyl-tRNA synthetase